MCPCHPLIGLACTAMATIAAPHEPPPTTPALAVRWTRTLADPVEWAQAIRVRDAHFVMVADAHGRLHKLTLTDGAAAAPPLQCRPGVKRIEAAEGLFVRDRFSLTAIDAGSWRVRWRTARPTGPVRLSETDADPEYHPRIIDAAVTRSLAVVAYASGHIRVFDAVAGAHRATFEWSVQENVRVLAAPEHAAVIWADGTETRARLLNATDDRAPGDSAIRVTTLPSVPLPSVVASQLLPDGTVLVGAGAAVYRIGPRRVLWRSVLAHPIRSGGLFREDVLSLPEPATSSAEVAHGSSLPRRMLAATVGGWIALTIADGKTQSLPAQYSAHLPSADTRYSIPLGQLLVSSARIRRTPPVFRAVRVRGDEVHAWQIEQADCSHDPRTFRKSGMLRDAGATPVRVVFPTAEHLLTLDGRTMRLYTLIPDTGAQP